MWMFDERHGALSWFPSGRILRRPCAIEVSSKRVSKGESQGGGSTVQGARVPALCEVPASKGGRKRRASRSRTLPPAPEDRTLDYAASRDELHDIEPGEIVLAVERLEGFREVVRPALKAADAARLSPRPGEKKRRGRLPSFHALDYWRLEMLRRVIASHSTQHTRDWLTTDKAARTRELLNFHERRAHYGGKAKRWMDGVPSDGWMSDFRTKWMPESELAGLMEQLERRALAEKMATLPEMREECRILHADGSKLETHATPPHLKKNKAGEVIGIANKWKKGRDGKRVPAITAPEAGFVPNSKGNNADHSGAGWNIIMVMSSKGTVLAHHNVPLHASESGTLAEMVPEVGQVLGTLGEPELRVLTTDGAFHSHETRRALRDVGIVENTHLSSHSKRESSKRKATERNKKRYSIAGYPDWFATGHRELVCRCERGKTTRVAGLDPRGRAVARLKGECAECGSILITSGLWRLSGEKFVKCLPSERSSEGELDFGNPLTFHDELAKEYGCQRFNGQEGAFGSQFTQRWKLLKSKRWFYRQTQVNLEVAAVVTITHALSLERWRRMGATGDDVAEADGGVGAGGGGLALAA